MFNLSTLLKSILLSVLVFVAFWIRVQAILFISVCPDGSDCAEATQSAFNAKQWAEWVCKHADS